MLVRHRRAFTLLEVTIVMILVAITLVVVAGQFSQSSSAANARITQGSIETALDAVVENRAATGAFSVTAAVLEPYSPAVTYLDGVTESPDNASVSVLMSGSTVVLAAFDGTECWIKVRRYAGGGPPEVHAVTTTACSAAASGTAALGTPPADRGASWNRPWRLL